jgi:putative ABC transport system ATP-binding protein
METASDYSEPLRTFRIAMAPPASPSDPALRIRDLSFAFGESFSISVPSLEIPPGGELLLAGASGSGKSTLLLLIAGLLEPRSGQVQIGGEVITDLRGSARDRCRGRRIGMIFQTFHLLPGFSAAENVMLAMLFADRPAREHRDRAIGLLASLGIDEPHRPAEHYSVGQQQRIAVARALAAKPSLVLADEPTASLDPENADRTIALVRDACRAEGAALLLTSHDPRLRDTLAEQVDARSFAVSAGANA